jgi:hypothetical protein
MSCAIPAISVAFFLEEHIGSWRWFVIAQHAFTFPHICAFACNEEKSFNCSSPYIITLAKSTFNHFLSFQRQQSSAALLIFIIGSVSLNAFVFVLSFHLNIFWLEYLLFVLVSEWVHFPSCVWLVGEKNQVLL